MNFLGRLIVGAILTAGMYYFYESNILSKLDAQAQIEEYDSDDYEDDEDNGDYAYDDYDTESDW